MQKDQCRKAAPDANISDRLQRDVRALQKPTHHELPVPWDEESYPAIATWGMWRFIGSGPFGAPTLNTQNNMAVGQSPWYHFGW